MGGLGRIIVLLLLNEALAIFIGYFICNIINKKKDKKADGEEIISIVNESHEQGIIEETEAKMINNIFEFGDKQAKDIMTDRSNVVAIEAKQKLEDAIEVMLESSNSRFPVYKENIDNIIGILYLKDAVGFSRDKTNNKKSIDSIEGLLREAKFIPETRKVDILFASMRTMKLQLVIVIDEYGQTSGVVAMRDILEEIVGDINDEDDDDDGFIVVKKDNKMIIEGLTPLEDLEKTLDISFEDTDFETINGFLISKMERIPDKKEKFEIDYGGYRFKVLSVENNMVKQVLVTKSLKIDEKNIFTDDNKEEV